MNIFNERGHMSNEDLKIPEGSVILTSPWGGRYDSMYKRDKYARDRVMKAARLLLPFVKDIDTILDVGCFTMEAKKYFPRSVTYIGIDEKAYHRDTRVVNLHHGFEPIPCQHALCLEVLEHLLDPLDVLESVQQSLSDDGRFVVSLPNEASMFHRMRSLFGIVDAQCFQGEGKHLHLPSESQCKKFLSRYFSIERQLYYISPSGVGSSQEWVGKILKIIPDTIHQLLADVFPSLFARGFIFLLRKKGASPVVSDGPDSSSS